MRRNLIVSSLLVCVATLMGSQAAFASDNWVGSWKLNTAKSTFASDDVTRAQTLTYESTPAGITLTAEGTDAQGEAMQVGFTSNFDGKEVANMRELPRVVADNTYENVWQMSGKQTMTAKVVVSNDSKTLTVTQTPAGTDGEAAKSVAVYDRQ